ncbi:MAG: AAA family ATPase [Cyclobacteriaceae bacterium]|nr:AAA family ATPase [Cyclobacteriaceae bacterium]
MITKIEVDGFKSLSKFDLRLKKGLNILVGPNGSGKTNVILFFEFLSNIITYEIGSAISLVGGAGTIFQKIGEQRYVDKISSKIYGCIQIRPKTYFVYEYFFEIKISFDKDNVYFINQEIRLRSASKFWSDPDDKKYTKEWDFHVQFIKGQDESEDLKILQFNREKIPPRFSFSATKSAPGLKDYLLDYGLSHNSIVRCLFQVVEYSRMIQTDLKGGETFNIIPSRVRELEDLATPPGIRKDGSGLATTLYAMKKGKRSLPRMERSRVLLRSEHLRTYGPETLKRIITYLKAANSTIKSLEVDNDPFSNKLIVKVSVTTGSYEAVLPLSAMSDGTIKWLTLITAILTSRSIFSIEEPENFLHPWMQAEIASIMRDHLSEKGSYAFVLMTTHSESLLNSARPEEVIKVDLREGGTVAKRITRLKAVKREISLSGFGLGHFYFANALSNE